MNNYDVIIIGAGPGGIFGAYELIEKNPDCKIAVFEAGHELAKRKCPIDGKKIKSCISCKSCSIMSGFGGAGAGRQVRCAQNARPRRQTRPERHSRPRELLRQKARGHAHRQGDLSHARHRHGGMRGDRVF